MTPYEYQAFPKAVYKGSTEDCVIINAEEERPEGYVDYEDLMGSESGADTEEEAKAAQRAKRAARKAAARERKAICDYLDEHNVEYQDNLPLEKLVELKEALDEHLKA